MSPLELALEAIRTEVVNADESPLFASISGLLVGYDARWRGMTWRTVEVEEEFQVPITNPETGRNSRTFTFAGKVDGVVEADGRQYLLEHKTASEEIADPNSPFWRRLAIDAQVSGYALAYWQLGRKFAGTLYDVIRKPTIRQRELTKAEVKEAVELGIYNGFEVTPDDRSRLAGGDKRESPKMFASRLACDAIANPDKYFQRRNVPRLDAELAEYAQELWDTADEIRQSRNHGRHYRNPNACMAYNSPCEYLPLCSGHESEDSGAYRKRESRHSELPSISDGLNVLSNSRMSCYRQCRRKHHLRYEVGLERDAEDREPLIYGRLVHIGLEAWWSFFKESVSEHGNDPSVIETDGSDADTIFRSVVGGFNGQGIAHADDPSRS